ncbi:MAG: hypothetical protein U5L08_12860 [Xanthomonadales bacterium]|nr:hypothetical protein [Xanthomonadales bacterium]
MTDSDTTTKPRPLLIVLNEAGVRVEPEWLESLQQQWPGEIALSEGGPGTDGADVLPGSRGPWWTWLGNIESTHARNGVVLVAAGLALPERFADRLAHLLAAADCPPLLTLPGNHQAGLDPAGGLIEPCDDCDRNRHDNRHDNRRRHRPGRRRPALLARASSPRAPGHHSAGTHR